MSSTQARPPQLLPSLSPELLPTVVGRTESLLLKIVRTNLNTQYASKGTLLAEFRDAISAHAASSDPVLIEDFRSNVPLSDYDSYKPFMIAFDKQLCREAEVENIFAPGLPSLLAESSATSGQQPKVFPKYNFSMRSTLSKGEGLCAVILFYGYRGVKNVEREPGHIVKRIPVSSVTVGMTRAILGWTNIDDDDSRMAMIAPSFVAPFAASMITHHKSFLMIHALFALACRDLESIVITFSTLFYDLVQYINEHWDMFLSCIENGTAPDLSGVHEVKSYLQGHFHANPDRSAELGEIGPPFSHEGWAALVWPKLRTVRFGCSGSFAAIIPKVKSIIGPTIAIHPLGYASTESLIAEPFRPDSLDTFVIQSSDLVEFLDVTAEESHKSLLQAWELEVGQRYEIVLTTNDGLWRYRLGDIIDVVGFDGNDGSPVFTLSSRSLGIRLAPMMISDVHIMSAIQAVGSDVLQVNEFTTVLDDRGGTPTVGYLIELAGPPGPNAHLATSRLSEGLAGAISEFQTFLDEEYVRFPTVRIVKSGTFAKYREWRAERMNIGPGQVKLPTVLQDETCREWILAMVVKEL